MDIRFECSKCGQHISAPEDMVGQVFNCPNPQCGYQLTVPAHSTLPKEVQTQSHDIVFNCPFCQHNLVVEERGAGLEIACPQCSKMIVVPSRSATAPPPQLVTKTAAWTPPPPPPPMARTGQPSPPSNLPPSQSTPPVMPAPVPLTSASPLKSGSHDKMVEKVALQEAIRNVVKGGITILALMVFQWIICSLLTIHKYVFNMTVQDWIRVLISLVVVGIAVRHYRSVNTIVALYMTRLGKVETTPERHRYLGNIITTARYVTLLAYILSVYIYLLPRVSTCNYAFIHFRLLTTILNITVFIAVIGIIFLLWKNVQPLISLLTGQVADKISAISSNTEYVACSRCKTENVQNATFCSSCGARIQSLPPSQPKISIRCPKCSYENVPTARFCLNCGAVLTLHEIQSSQPPPASLASPHIPTILPSANASDNRSKPPLLGPPPLPSYNNIPPTIMRKGLSDSDSLMKKIQLCRKVTYFVFLGCFGGLFVTISQPKDARVDKIFIIILGAGILLCLGIGFGLSALEGRIDKHQ